MASASELVVVAFDFGTTFSGYAFSFRDDPLKVQANNYWVAGSLRLMSLKTPTCVLLDPNDEFHSFGFAAENKYISLAEDQKNKGWKLFRQFKMLLHSNEVCILFFQKKHKVIRVSFCDWSASVGVRRPS